MGHAGLGVYLALLLLAEARAFLFQQHFAVGHIWRRSSSCERAPPSLCPSVRHSSSAPRRLTGLRLSETASVDAVLELIRGTDIGANSTALPPEKRIVLYDNLDALELEARESADGRDPLGPRGAAIGMWTVDFVGETDASNEVRQKKSSPAGGYWRGELGRKIFRTDGLYQHVLEFKGGDVPPYAKIGLRDAVRRRERARELSEEIKKMEDGEWDGFGPSPAVLARASGAANVTEAGIGIRDSAQMQTTELVAVNLIQVLLFNLVPISIVLVGLVTRLSADNRAAVRRKALESGRAARMQGGSLESELPALTPNTVRVDFAPPIIAAGPAWLQRLFKLSAGPSTDVFLDTTFVDTNVRLGRGATSGSRFVFKRVPDETRPAAESWQGLVDKSAPPALPLRFVGQALKWCVLFRILASAAAFYLADPVTVKVLCHGAGPSVVSALTAVGQAARGFALSGAGAWLQSLALLAVAWAVSKSGGGIVRGEERSA